MSRTAGRRHLFGLLGPAFVAAIAYVDPGNIAANLSAGSRYGYALVWVLASASLMAVIAQYLSARLGIVTGQSLASLVSDRLRRHGRVWQVGHGALALVIAAATDLAEVVGGALGLYLLFGWPLWLGGLLVGGATLLLLPLLRSRGEQVFEWVVAGFGGLVALAFFAGLAWAPPDPLATLAGLVPGAPAGAWPLVAAMLGATVMPHAIYLHSALAVDRYRPDGELVASIPHLLRVQIWDVLLALLLAGSVNIAMLLYGAAALRGVEADTIEQAHASLGSSLGPVAAAALGAGLLASGLGSAIVGTHAGSHIVRDSFPLVIPTLVRRSVTLLPAVVLLLTGLSATLILVASQVVLSFGIAFVLGPLAWFTGRSEVMGAYVVGPALRVVSWIVVGLVVALNVTLLITAA